jgi:photosystem II stability/assembly factor-like uncharacterized protein
MKQVFAKFKPVLLFILLCLIFSVISYGKVDPKIFAEIKPRAIGPANMSGRIGSIDFSISNPNVIYVGTATGGVWKSENGGLNWQPIFDDQPVSSIGAIRIFQANPNIVWVGTGEANPRNSVGVGQGVFKTLDGGKTWSFLGLGETEKISRIILDQNNPAIAYVAAMGTTWGENKERGVYKTTDGGKTWKKILYVDTKTGAADLVVAPDNPNKLIAAMWQHRRWPWFFNSGGPGSGLYITSDGGKKWKKLSSKEGLPKGDLGRIGVAFATNKPNIAYALVEAKKNVLLRSTDGGFTWKTANNKPGVHGRPFYYSDIRVNPKNENILYSLQSRLQVSEDSGKNFRVLPSRGQAHADFQAMRIHPNGEYMVVGTDGGIVISHNRGKSWRFARNLPLGQFYHVSFDMAVPYNVYGGLQDNGSWFGPSEVLLDRAIYNYHWRRVNGGDGFDTEPDPEKPGCGYAMSQGGYINYFDANTGASWSIRPTITDVKHRYNWNAALAIDPFKPSTIYYGSQFVHLSKDKGLSWEVISPDLTTNDKEKQKQAESGGLTLDVTNAENHTTIMCIAPSGVKKGVIWVGTDDGHVQVTQDEGKNWQLVSLPLTGSKTQKGKVPYGTWVPHVEASKFNPACAFVVFEDHRRSNWTPYIFMTQDYGKTWTDLATKEIKGFVHVIEQDHLDKNLLFLGTEFGLYFSTNRGKNWNQWTSGFPTVPVHDLGVHPRDNDLIIGTHGRSIYILDDISFLRGIDGAIAGQKAHLFKVNDTIQFNRSSVSAYSTRGDTEFMGPNPPNGALITFFYTPIEDKAEEKNTKERKKVKGKKKHKKGLKELRQDKGKKDRKKKQKTFKIEILNKEGKTIRVLKDLAPKAGINRVTWDLHTERMDIPGRGRGRGRRGLPGPLVFPDTYTVRMSYLDRQMKADFKVTSDPRFKIDLAAWKRNIKMTEGMKSWYKLGMDAEKKLEITGKMIKTVLQLAKDQDLKEETKKKLNEQAKGLQKKLKKLANILNPENKKQGIADRTVSLRSQLFRLYRTIGDEFSPVTQSSEVGFKKMKVKVETFIKDYNKVFSTDVEVFKKAVKESGLSFFKTFEPLSLTKKKEKTKALDTKEIK